MRNAIFGRLELGPKSFPLPLPLYFDCDVAESWFLKESFVNNSYSNWLDYVSSDSEFKFLSSWAFIACFKAQNSKHD